MSPPTFMKISNYNPAKKRFLNELNIYLGHPKEKVQSEMKLNSFTICSHVCCIERRDYTAKTEE
jgi:hypothetical protein